MNNLYYTILILLTLNSLTYSQSCLPNGITFLTQESINNFSTNYSGCKEIEGDVRIEGVLLDIITDIKGLSNLTYIKGNLTISAYYLTNLSGLGNLDSIGGHLSIGNFNTYNLSGLDSLKYIGGNLSISNNNSINSLSGLDNLNSIGRSVNIVNNSSLISFEGLDNLNSIGGSFSISKNDALISLTGLNNLHSIEGTLQISYNKSLNSISGIKNIDPNTIENQSGSSEDLIIHHNRILSDCEVENICNFLDISGKSARLHNNVTGCNSIEEIEIKCDPSSVNDLENSNIEIYPNPTTDKLIIDFCDTNLSTAVITLYNSSGNLLFEIDKKITDQSIIVNSKNLNPGLYVIRINSSKFGTSFRKIIIN